MIKRIVRQMLTAQILSALTVSICLLIDSIMIGRFLGVDAIAAYGLANPVLLIIGAVANMLAAGIQVACGKSLGQGSQEETNRGFSAALALTAAISIAGVTAVLLFRAPLATLMGTGTSGILFDDTRNYMAGFIIGAPASMGALVLVPFLQLAGQSNLLIAAVLGMTLADVGLDLLNVLVFGGGMFGMGLASSLSYYIAMLIGGTYFLSKRCVFRFSLRAVSWKKIVELLRSGVPAVFTMASSVILIYILNKLLLRAGGSDAVAAFSVMTTIGNASNCISTGMGGVALSLSGILYNEEDRTGLNELLRLLIPRAVLLGLGVGAILAAFAPAFVSLFIPEAGVTQAMAILGVRLFALGLVPCCMNNALKYTYQGIDRVCLMELFALLEGAILPALAAVACARFLGVTGVWLYFILGEGFALLGLCGYVWLKARRVSLKGDDFLMLPASFGVPPEALFERGVYNLRDVTLVSEDIRQFCLSHGQGAKSASRIALCAEEIAKNTVVYGFTAHTGRGRRHLSVRLQIKDDRCVLRFRDDCSAFDPVRYITQRPDSDSAGLRLVSSMADEIRYTYSLNLNNLTLIFLAQ